MAADRVKKYAPIWRFGQGRAIAVSKNPEHKHHDEIREWIVEDFDPHAVDIEDLMSDVAALAKK